MSKFLHRTFLGSVLLILAAPLIVVLGVSVNEPKRLLFPPEGFSLNWYGELFVQGAWVNALTNSIVIAVFASMLAVAIALPLSLYIWTRDGFVA